jgi:2'-5' RNA ligase
MRSFLGVFLPRDIQYDYKSFKQQLRKQKQNLDFVSAPDLHLTLKYLGPSVNASTIEEIKNIIPNVLRSHKFFELKISDIKLGFHHEKFPNVLNINYAPNTKLIRLVDDIEQALGGGRFRDILPPKRDYIPHTTIAKLHGNIHRKKINEVRDAVNNAGWEGTSKSISVNCIKLINSEKLKSGYIYREICEFTLSV